MDAIDIVGVDSGFGSEDPEQDAHGDRQELAGVSSRTEKDVVVGGVQHTHVAITHQSSEW